MKTFDEMYNELQVTDQSDFKIIEEEVKKEKQKKNRIALIACLAVDAIILKFTFGTINLLPKFGVVMMIQPMITLVIMDFMIYAILTAIFSKNQRKYAKLYKEIIIKKLMNNFYGSPEYFPEKEMPQYIYKEPQYNESYNRYSSEDYLEAVINEKYSIQMGEVVTKKVEHRSSSRGGSSTTTRIIFHGLFAKIVMNKSINGELKILRNGATLFDKKRLTMDSGEFEKHFDVSASDKIAGMQLLTADVMEELIEFISKTNILYDVVIKNDILYV